MEHNTGRADRTTGHMVCSRKHMYSLFQLAYLACASRNRSNLDGVRWDFRLPPPYERMLEIPLLHLRKLCGYNLVYNLVDRQYLFDRLPKQAIWCTYCGLYTNDWRFFYHERFKNCLTKDDLTRRPLFLLPPPVENIQHFRCECISCGGKGTWPCINA